MLFIVLIFAPVPDSARQIEGLFTLQRLVVESWTAKYCFNVPVRIIRFNRPFEGLRKDAWQIMDADFELVHTDRTAKIRRKDGKPFNCAAVELQQYTERPQADYFDFSAVSDGGASVFTGYFLSQVRVEDNWYDTILKAKYIGSEGEKAITREPGRLVEQFDYYGTQDPLETDGIVAVVDSALPANITSNITETISAVNALLAETFDFYPKEPYLVLIAADFKAFEGYSV